MTAERRRPYTTGEEIANSVSHGAALVAAAVAAPFPIIAAARGGTAADIVGASVFAATMVLLYAASMLYHAVPHPRAKRLLRKLDRGIELEHRVPGVGLGGIDADSEFGGAAPAGSGEVVCRVADDVRHVLGPTESDRSRDQVAEGRFAVD